MKPSLQLKLTQHLALTPQLQQSIRLLQLSTLELNQELDQVLQDNPLLERLDDPLGGACGSPPDGVLEPPSAPEAGDIGGAGGDAAPDGTNGADGTGAGAGEPRRRARRARRARRGGRARGGDWGSDSSRARGDEDDDEREVPRWPPAGVSLREHLARSSSAPAARAATARW